jgi:hypothetical protein
LKAGAFLVSSCGAPPLATALAPEMTRAVAVVPVPWVGEMEVSVAKV